MNQQRSILMAILSLAVSGMAQETPVWDAPGYDKTVAPFFKDHCLRCHGPDKQKGEFRTDTHLPRNFLDLTARGKWGEVVNALNSHEMPPEDEPQPDRQQVSAVVDWITQQMVQAELIRRDGTVVLRRLNRDEYRNTVRDLTGVDFDVSGFPIDPAAGGFDNNGRALTVSPMLMEIHVDAARRIFDRALVTGDRPATVRWRFEPEEGSGDDHRIRLPDKQNPIVHGGKNEKRGGMTVMHHASWDRNPNARDFKLPQAGEYIIRVRAAGKVPAREAVVASAKRALEKRIAENKDAKGKEWQLKHLEEDLDHFRNDRMYNYGPPRLKLLQDFDGQPRVIAEWDVAAPLDQPQVYEFRARFPESRTGLTLEYAYSVPSVLENFWMQSKDDFARPEAHVDWFEIEGPYFDAWPPASHTRLLPESPLRTSDERAYARQVITSLMQRAWRRPVTEAEIESRLALFDAAKKTKPEFVEAIKTPFIAILASPHFLYLSEPAGSGKEGTLRPLNDYEVATRLSYFLWSTMPDETLTKLATEGRLRDPKILSSETNRLLADPRSSGFVTNFAGQWIGLREAGANPPAPDLYPQYDRHLEKSITGESLAFFSEILRRDLPVENFLKSDFVTINERLARHYGIDGVRGDEFRPVKVPAGVHRGGLATHASILTITSNGTRTSPVKRGVWILKTLLGTDPGLPVANAGDIKPKVPGIDKATVRQRLQIHRELPQCARCHDKIDPLGFALENFNAAGEWREQEGHGYKGRIDQNDPAIDAGGKLPDGASFKSVDEMLTLLAGRKDQFRKAFASRVYAYALGREMGIADQPVIKASTTAMETRGDTIRAVLLHSIVTSPAFLTK